MSVEATTRRLCFSYLASCQPYCVVGTFVTVSRLSTFMVLSFWLEVTHIRSDPRQMKNPALVPYGNDCICLASRGMENNWRRLSWA